jgi:hypothetical protein
MVSIALGCILMALERTRYNLASVTRHRWAFIVTSTFGLFFITNTLGPHCLFRLHHELRKLISQTDVRKQNTKAEEMLTSSSLP